MTDGKCYFVLSTAQVFPLGSVLWEMFSTNAFREIYYGSSRISRMSLEKVWLLRIEMSTNFNPKPCLLQNRRAASLVFIARVCPLASTSCSGRLPHVVERGKNLLEWNGCTFDSDWTCVKNPCTKYLQSTFTYLFLAWLCHHGVCVTVTKGNTPSPFIVLTTIIWSGSPPLSHTWRPFTQSLSPVYKSLA